MYNKWDTWHVRLIPYFIALNWYNDRPAQSIFLRLWNRITITQPHRPTHKTGIVQRHARQQTTWLGWWVHIYLLSLSATRSIFTTRSIDRLSLNYIYSDDLWTIKCASPWQCHYFLFSAPDDVSRSPRIISWSFAFFLSHDRNKIMFKYKIDRI